MQQQGKTHLTTGDIASHFVVAVWQARRAIDAVAPHVPRAGQYRFVPVELLPAVEAELRRRGYLTAEVTAHAS